MQLLFRVSVIVFVMLVFLVTGFHMGGKTRTQLVVSDNVGRFQKMTESTAFDTKTGQICDTEAVPIHGDNVPEGLVLDTGHPLCSAIK